MAIDDRRKKNLYKYVTVAGLLSFLPFVLTAGPFGGYFLGAYLEKRFSFPPYTTIICVTIGFIAGVRETVRIVKFALRTQEISENKKVQP